MKYFIPARKGSKGFPLKNRKLINFTLQLLHDCKVNKKDMIVSTDDEIIVKTFETYGIGNIKNNSLTGLWEKLKKQKTEMNNGVFNNIICKKCNYLF